MGGRRPLGTRWLRRGVLAFALVLFASFGASSAAAATLPPQGIFEECDLDTQMQTCVQRLQVMHEGGLQIVVIPAWATSLTSLASYAATAHSLGMSVMWQMAGPGPFWWDGPPTSTSMAPWFPTFASACGCDQNGPLLSYVIQWLSQLPGTYGYYAADVFDDTLSGGQSAVAQYVDQIKQVDPIHTVMIGSADEAQTQQYVGIPDVVGAEIYPVTTSSLMPASANQDTWGAIAQEASDTQRFADGAGKQSAFILQAFTWGDNLADGQTIGVCSASDTQSSCYSKLMYPSSADQLQLRNEVLTHAHPKLILWFNFSATYGQTGDDTYSIYPTGSEAAARWSGLSAAIQAPFPTSSTPAHSNLVSDRDPRAHTAIIHHRKRHRKHHRRRHRKHRRRRPA